MIIDVPVLMMSALVLKVFFPLHTANLSYSSGVQQLSSDSFNNQNEQQQQLNINEHIAMETRKVGADLFSFYFAAVQ